MQCVPQHQEWGPHKVPPGSVPLPSILTHPPEPHDNQHANDITHSGPVPTPIRLDLERITSSKYASSCALLPPPHRITAEEGKGTRASPPCKASWTTRETSGASHGQRTCHMSRKQSFHQDRFSRIQCHLQNALLG